MKELLDPEAHRLREASKALPRAITANQYGNLHQWDVHIEIFSNKVDQANRLRWIQRKKPTI